MGINKDLRECKKIQYADNKLLVHLDNKVKVYEPKTFKQGENGFFYERYVGDYFLKQGYKVKFNGLEKGFFDRGIDLIVESNNEKLFLQCKLGNITKNSMQTIMYRASKFLYQEYLSQKEKKKVQFRIVIPKKDKHLGGKRKNKRTGKVIFLTEEALLFTNKTQQYINGEILEIPFTYESFNQ